LRYGPSNLTYRRVIIASLAACGLAFAGYRFVYPPPPDIRNVGYTSASFDLREWDETLQKGNASTNDASVVNGLASVLASGHNDTNCRCMPLAVATLKRADGKQFSFAVMPSHRQTDCQVAVGSERYSVDRQKFLAAVAPLGLPSERWTGP
jgi:hypothetical protein